MLVAAKSILSVIRAVNMRVVEESYWSKEFPLELNCIIRDFVVYDFTSKEELKWARREWCDPETRQEALEKYDYIIEWGVVESRI